MHRGPARIDGSSNLALVDQSGVAPEPSACKADASPRRQARDGHRVRGARVNDGTVPVGAARRDRTCLLLLVMQAQSLDCQRRSVDHLRIERSAGSLSESPG